MEKVIKDGMVAVIHSGQFGAGWNSCYPEFPALIFHPKLVELIEADKKHEITVDLVRGILGLAPNYWLCFNNDLSITWVPVGVKFRIQYCDGSEYVVMEGDDTWFVA